MARAIDQRCKRAGRSGGYGGDHGYTLLEALTVVAVLGVLLAASLPSFHDAGLRSTLKSAADRLRSDMGEARTTARERAQFVYLSFVRASDGASWCWGLSLAPSCDCRLDDRSAAAFCFVDRDAASASPLPRFVRSSDYRSVLLDALPLGGSLRFSPVRPDLVAGNISFSAAGSGETLRVVVSSLGRLRLCSPAGAHAVPGLPPC
ncbi:MAG: type secretory pathway, pseudopilin PulG [Hydrocarboniphaga sp.]|uniref:GspH/FimT family pseudopilin n=1 Tax=Hydrocarboniphaga sp. TaxID=2033016 RepID=UPI002627819A|nr:GspH/FimT family pseudopilin [Hydrocarboniphaga sp.]MDB5968800.1 type secretory pathway, pseudopilin PulG [Hydrocarboniphaga sp.]